MVYVRMNCCLLTKQTLSFDAKSVSYESNSSSHIKEGLSVCPFRVATLRMSISSRQLKEYSINLPLKMIDI